MIEAIVASTLTIYVLFAILGVVLFLAAYNDSIGVAFLATVIGFLAFQFLSKADPWGYVQQHPKDLAFWALAYFPIGIAWSFFRWWRVLNTRAADLMRNKDTWTPAYGETSWADHVKKYMPKASNHKSSISCWITYWPFSVAAYLLVDILCDIGNWIYNLISGLYQRLADHVTNSLLGD